MHRCRWNPIHAAVWLALLFYTVEGIEMKTCDSDSDLECRKESARFVTNYLSNLISNVTWSLFYKSTPLGRLINYTETKVDTWMVGMSEDPEGSKTMIGFGAELLHFSQATVINIKQMVQDANVTAHKYISKFSDALRLLDMLLTPYAKPAST